jgi:hypothetical protein
MWSPNDPFAKHQVAAILGQFDRVGVQKRRDESGGTTLKELLERLKRAADPATGETISQADLMQAIDSIRTDLRAQLKNR